MSLVLRNGWTLRDYRWLQVAFGAYLAVHFGHLVPWGAELFSSEGVIPRAADSPVAYVLPNVLTFFDGRVVVTALLLLATLLSLVFAAGPQGRSGRVVAVSLWYLWACFHARNPLIGNPGLPYVGWMLLAHAVILPARGQRRTWRFPADVFAAGWILMALGYTYSAATKLVSPSWLDGNALRYILENPLARDTALRQLILQLPDAALRLGTWGVLGLELVALPLALSSRSRPWLWTALFALHLGLLVLIDFADLTFGMVLLHLFTFDPAWIRSALQASIRPSPASSRLRSR